MSNLYTLDQKLSSAKPTNLAVLYVMEAGGERGMCFCPYSVCVFVRVYVHVYVHVYVCIYVYVCVL